MFLFLAFLLTPGHSGTTSLAATEKQAVEKGTSTNPPASRSWRERRVTTNVHLASILLLTAAKTGCLGKSEHILPITILSWPSLAWRPSKLEVVSSHLASDFSSKSLLTHRHCIWPLEVSFSEVCWVRVHISCSLCVNFPLLFYHLWCWPFLYEARQRQQQSKYLWDKFLNTLPVSPTFKMCI